MSSIDEFIRNLARMRREPDRFNQYQAGDDANNRIRRENLRLYLSLLLERQPKTLLVMEAPGYRGCRLTGVPVTSRRVLLNGVPELDFFGTKQGFTDVADVGFENVQGEQSATIVWSTLADLRHLPVIWNTYPFHPRKADSPRSNRKPRKAETALGSDYLRVILGLFKPEVVIAVGNVAEATLMGMGVNCVKVRHPAQGGKNDFVTSLTALLG